jgi:predicted nucleic acid-binding protein
MIFVDSDVFLIDLRYRRDRRHAVNTRFLRRLRDRGDGFTTTINLLEICGVLSFNLSPRQVRELYVHLPARYRIRVIPTHEPTIALPRLTPAAVLQIMETRASFGDAQVLAVLRSMEPPPDQVISWNAAHFAGRLMAPVATPTEAVG